MLTHYYRLMNKNGGYTWLQTCATVVCSSKNADEQNIICVNYVVSNRENENLILDCIQLENGLDTIKHEEPLADNGGAGGSPGSDPSSEGPAGPRSGDHHKTTKSETPEPKTRSRNLSGAANSVNGVDHSPSVDGGACDLHVLPSVSSATATRKPHKRKVKQMDVADECPSKMVPPNSIGMQDLNGSGRLHDDQTESSVKELENAMSKHLPSPVGINHNNNNTTTDFSTDALLKQQEQEKSSTIQWIGAHHQHSYHQQSPPMPATALLRQLYANRESVIRATARQGSNGVFYGKYLGIIFQIGQYHLFLYCIF